MIFNDQLNKYNTTFLNQLKNLQFFIDFLQSNFFVQRKIRSKTQHFQFFVLQLIFLRSFSFPNRSKCTTDQFENRLFPNSIKFFGSCAFDNRLFASIIAFSRLFPMSGLINVISSSPRPMNTFRGASSPVPLI